jgi:hypothetical protein
MKKFLAALALVAGLALPARADQSMILGPTFTVTAATNATPIVVTVSGTHNVPTDGQVVIQGALGNLAANGVFRCHVVAATTCSLQAQNRDTQAWADVAGTGAWTSGGTFNFMGATGTGPGPWFDCLKCIKLWVFVYGDTPVAPIVRLEETSNPGGAAPPTAPHAGPATPLGILRDMNLPLTAVSDGNLSPAVNSRWLRLNVVTYTSGVVYATIGCLTSQGTQGF